MLIAPPTWQVSSGVDVLPELWQGHVRVQCKLWPWGCDNSGDVQAFHLPHILIHILHLQHRSFTQICDTAP